MSDVRLEKLDDRLSGVERSVNDLRSDVRVANERQEQRHSSMVDAVKQVCGKVAQHDETLYLGTEKDDAHDVRIARLEGFAGRVKAWGSWILGLLSAAVIGLGGWIFSRGNQ